MTSRKSRTHQQLPRVGEGLQGASSGPRIDAKRIRSPLTMRDRTFGQNLSAVSAFLKTPGFDPGMSAICKTCAYATPHDKTPPRLHNRKHTDTTAGLNCGYANREPHRGLRPPMGIRKIVSALARSLRMRRGPSEWEPAVSIWGRSLQMRRRGPGGKWIYREPTTEETRDYLDGEAW
jgi:hypothetical protein